MVENTGQRLVARDQPFPCGYGPRSIRLSLESRDTLFVGCKDGSVTKVDLTAAAAEEPEKAAAAAKKLCGPGPTGIRSLCDLANGWLLLGQDHGGVSVLPWQRVGNGDQKPRTLDLGITPDAGAVGYVGRWDPETFIVSPRRTSAILLRLVHNPDGDPPFMLERDRELKGVLGMSGFARTSTGERWILCKTGALWLQRGDDREPESREGAWRESGFERPGYVFDYAVVSSDPEGPNHGVYLTSDEGVFLLRPEVRPSAAGGPDGPEQGSGFRLDAVYLPGFTGTCIGIAHAVRGQSCYLWISDVEGSVQLFWSDSKFWEPGGMETPTRWQRSILVERRFPVVRAIASWKLDSAIVLGQACRDDRIVVSWFDSPPARPAGSERWSAAELLAWGTLADLREKREDEDSKDERCQWSSEALVADCIEEAGSDPEALRRFLRNPYGELARTTLEEIVRDPDATRRVVRALTLWTYALIGTVHRRLERPSPHDYLGIIRWLRRIGDALPALAQPDAVTVQNGLETNILEARKWGIFGGTYAARRSAHSVVENLKEQEAPERAFDSLVYWTRLFRQRVDLTSPLPDPPPRSLAPWNVQPFTTSPRASGPVEWVIVSWEAGGIVYSRKGRDLGWEILPVKGAERGQLELVRELGRRTLLCDGAQGGSAWLLSTPLMDPGTPGGEQIQLRRLHEDMRLEADARLNVSELVRNHRADESVFSFLDLGKGRVAVGLEGVSGIAQFGVLMVSAEGRLHALRDMNREEIPLPPTYPEFKTSLDNPVWAMTFHEIPEGVALFLGCGDGQIWRVLIKFDAAEGYTFPKPTLVGRAGAAISALACQPRSGPDGCPLRVFAGTADGSLVAFQASSDEESYVILWATEEEGRIQSLYTLTSPLVEDPEEDGTRDPARRRLVLAVTRQGMAVPFLDRPMVEGGDPWAERHRRPQMPGERLGRVSLRSTVFASALVRDLKDDERALARLIVAPASGTPQILTFYHPYYTAARKRAFKDLQSRWRKSLEDEHDTIQGHLLRLPDVTYAAAPELPLMFVRWILSPDATAKPWEERCKIAGPAGTSSWPRQWVPRHLRPLVELDSAWSRGEDLRGLLWRALERAHEVGDRSLFKEILQTALSRANHLLFAEATGDSDLGFAPRFVQLLQDLEKAEGQWEGEPNELDTRMRITASKSVLDGDTLWGLSQALGSPAKAARAGQAVAARDRVVHRALGKGSQLLAMETLRAGNLALLRLCRRLDRKPASVDWTKADGRHCVRWEVLRGFFEAVGDFAARAAHPHGSLGEVAAHEICRAYALGMLVCPPAVVRLATWFGESDLPPEAGTRVLEQLTLAESLLGGKLELGDEFRRLAEIALPGKRSHQGSLFSKPEKGPDWLEDPQAIGSDNVELVRVRRRFDEIIAWLRNLAHQLADDAGRVALEEHRALLEQIEALGLAAERGDAPDADAALQFQHSQRFWNLALEALKKKCDGSQVLFVSPEASKEDSQPQVRPELVVFSRTLEFWCRDQREAIQERRREYQLFEPTSSLYDAALALVQRAAERFRQGAAVQKNLVLGVLGHGLLELLDEHLLELWEVAQALDPRRTWESEKRGARDRKQGAANSRHLPESSTAATSTAGKFSEYLLQRALKGEVIPKNLRSLQGLLSYAEEDGDESPCTLGQLLAEFRSWKVKGLRPALSGLRLDPRTYHFLHLIMSELAQNAQLHGRQDRSPSVRATSAGDRVRLEFDFQYPKDDNETRERVDQLYKDHLQSPIKRRRSPRVPSHGMGLYLANLAAAVVGWKLDVEKPKEAGRLRCILSQEEADAKAGSTRRGGR
jgi:hypothetical protein